MFVGPDISADYYLILCANSKEQMSINDSILQNEQNTVD